VIADVSSYEQMLAALRSRVNELQINGERFDEYSGLPRGYLSKLIGAKPVRRLGMTSFAPVLAGLGLRLLIIENQDATERLKNKLPPRNQSYVRTVAVHTNLTTRFLQKIGRNGSAGRRSESAVLPLQSRTAHSSGPSLAARQSDRDAGTG
jgi:hypothetical protein